MDFEFTEQERMYRDGLRDFLNREFAPIVDKMDAKGPLTRDEAIEVMKKFKKIGMGLDPESARGLVGSPMIFGIFAEEVGKVWPSILPLFGMGAIPAMFVPLASEDVKRRLMPKLREGEFIGCFAETESEAGCDTSKLKTTASLRGDYYVVNGAKTWISNATIADTAFVGVTNTETGLQKFLLVEKDISPWKTNELHKIGWRASPTGEMFFEDCRVPKENEMGVLMQNAFNIGPKLTEVMPLSGGFVKLLGTMEPFTAMMTLPRAGMALASVGIAQAALDASLKYAKERKQFGKPIGKFQLIQGMLYEMAVSIETARLLGYKAIDLVVKGDPDVRRFSSMAKVYAGEACVKATYNAMQIHGGMGLSSEMPLERYFRDARMMTIPDGTSEIMKLVTGYTLLGKGFSAYV
jgi:alkylation response protein AidB-like acyl-CoA dehydrogenase